MRLKKLEPSPNIKRIRRLKKLEKFAEEQIDRYVKIHKKNAKDLKYIG